MIGIVTFPPPGFRMGTARVPGIDVFEPADSTEKRPDMVDFKCPKCGATTAFSVSEGKLTCEYCGYSESPDAETLGRLAEQFEFKVETLQRSQQGWGEERKELSCQRCGGTVSVPPDMLAFTCPFCGSNKVLYREPLEDVLRPRFLIPFKVDPQSCKAITRKWLGNSWMLPSELLNVAVDKFNPIYIPYWTFDASCNAVWKAMVAQQTTEVYKVRGEMREDNKVTYKEEAGKVQKVFQGLLVPGTNRLRMKTLSRVDGFDIKDLTRYEPRYLAGMQAQAYDLPLEEAWQIGRHIMRERTRQTCLDRASSSNVNSFNMALDFCDERWRYILTPIYASVYQYRDHTYQILVNGQTGAIAGPRPVDWEKIWLVIAALLTPGLLIGIFGLLNSATETGILISGLGMILEVIAVVIAFFMIQQGQALVHD